jgi:RNA polymerase sigma-70 factor (ECF subfamily)
LNREQLAALVRTHQAGIYRYVRYLGAPPAIAEDLCQEAFLVAVKGASRNALGDVRSAGAWLRGVARNLFLARCRRQRANPVVLDSRAVDRAEDLWQTEFLRGGDGADYLEALRQCLAGLPPAQREWLQWHYRDGLSRAEMSRRTRLTEDGVKAALRRLRARLAECIGRRLGLAPEGPA